MGDTTTGDWLAASEETSADWPTIPGYEILGELGRGGMGVVYKARQTSPGRLVALKLIRDPALAGPEERARFRLEAEAATRMQHPNIVQIYDLGEHSGRPYFAMELVDGGSLDRHLAGRPLPAAQAALLLRSVALAVEHAHAQKIVHRDLKPANILLRIGDRSRREDGGSGGEPTECASGAFPVASDSSHEIPGHTPHNLPFSPLVTDFGLAKRLDSSSTALTRQGAVLGTAGYMAPEQAGGRVDQVGPGTDIYGLGAILYELLTGRPPFQADSWNAMVQQVLHDEPAPPNRLQADIPIDLQTVCLKCLEKEPGRRYTSALELAEDLNRFLAGQPVLAVPLTEHERLARLAARDGYQLVGEIGRGPRSTVYHAHFGPLQQPVAVKVFRSVGGTREDWDSRLRSAADQWSALAHPQVVPMQRAGWWDNAPFVVHEYLPQGSLADSLSKLRPARGSTALRERVASALGLTEQLTEIVIYLHRQGVIHGNLKPSNVLLAAGGIPRILDLHPTGGLFQDLLTLDDEEHVSMGYLAPELLSVPPAEARLSTDIYGLGLILYELLTGSPPFSAATAQEMRQQVQAVDPMPPSQLNPEVSPHVEAVCLRCLRKNPWRRYYRAYDLLRRLRQLQEENRGGENPQI